MDSPILHLIPTILVAEDNNLRARAPFRNLVSAAASCTSDVYRGGACRSPIVTDFSSSDGSDLAAWEFQARSKHIAFLTIVHYFAEFSAVFQHQHHRTGLTFRDEVRFLAGPFPHTALGCFGSIYVCDTFTCRRLRIKLQFRSKYHALAAGVPDAGFDRSQIHNFDRNPLRSL